MARQFSEQLEHEVNLAELNRMTDIQSKSRPAAPTYPPPPPEFSGEPIAPAAAPATEPDATPTAEIATPPPPPYVYSPEAEAQSLTAMPETILTPPDDPSPPTAETLHERAV
jgi:hypothetical protein